MSTSPAPAATATPHRALRDKARRWRYWAATAPFVLFFAVSAISALLDIEGSLGQFRYLGYPEFLAVPLSILEIVGIVTILWGRSRALTDLAFAGFLLELVLAGTGHALNGDPDLWLIALGLIVWTAAFLADRQRHPRVAGYVRAQVSRPVVLVYWASHAALFVVFTASVLLTVFDLPTSITQAEGLGYPGYTSLPLAVLKALGLIAIFSRRSRVLANFAYAGFFYDLVLALSAHALRLEPYGLLALGTLIAWVFCYWSDRMMYPQSPAEHRARETAASV